MHCVIPFHEQGLPVKLRLLRKIKQRVEPPHVDYQAIEERREKVVKLYDPCVGIIPKNVFPHWQYSRQ